MKNLMKLLLVLCMFGSVALADGDMGAGNRNCGPEGCPPPCTENCSIAQRGDDGTESISDAAEGAIEVVVDFMSDALGVL